MCLAIPAEIVEFLDDNMARVSIGGAWKVVSVMLVDGLAIGDHVIVHVGFALNKIDPREARRTLELLAEIGVNAAELSGSTGMMRLDVRFPPIDLLTK